jgi:signal transduction histidine kinase
MKKDRYKTKDQLIQELMQLRKELSALKISKSSLQNYKKEYQRKIIEYEKLSALGRLTANVAHEIRNPITVIGGFAEKLKKRMPQDTREREFLDLISIEAKRLEDILREVLLFSSKPFFRKEQHDINKVIIESLDIYKDIFKKANITIRMKFNDVTQIYIDKRQVMEGINNIISNAIDAMPNGGMLTVSTHDKVFRRKNYVTVRITDTGYGISEENLFLIFEPFFSTKVTKKETGLGLPITKKIVEGHGGFMRICSKVGKGSSFTLYFPYRATKKPS